MTPQQQSEAIVEKYVPYTGNDNWRDKAIMCAITEVEACIAIYKQVRYRKAFEHYQQILSHLKQM